MSVENESYFEARNAPAHDFLRTETLTGTASSRKVQSILASMKQSGWIGAPIQVLEIGPQKFIITGHHRVLAARHAEILVQFRVITEAGMVNYGYRPTDEVIQAHAETGPNCIRLRR